MSIARRLGSVFGRAAEQTPDSREHQAVVDLLVLAVYADEHVHQDELEALARFGAEHREWSEGSFSIDQYLGPSIAKVRAAVGSPQQVDELLRDVAGRVTTPALREKLAEYCHAVVQADGQVSSDEAGFVSRVRAVLG